MDHTIGVHRFSQGGASYLASSPRPAHNQCKRDFMERASLGPVGDCMILHATSAALTLQDPSDIAFLRFAIFSVRASSTRSTFLSA